MIQQKLCLSKGVADGVGGWRSYGINPGNFSLTLMRICENVVERNRFPAKDPVQLISRCYEEIEALRCPVMGKFRYDLQSA